MKVTYLETHKRVELVYCNTMRVLSKTGGPSTVVCSDISDFLKYEQHRLNLAQEYRENDMKVENKYYTEAVL